MPDRRQTQRYSSVALYLLALAPACYIAIIIFKYSVDVPQWDEWDFSNYLEKFAHGTLSLADLFKQQNEYRQFFPNLLFVGLSWLTKGDLRYQMVVSFLLACLISLNIYQLGKQTVSGGHQQQLWLFIAANVLIFSPIQYENWLQGQQVIFFVPVACVTTGLLVASATRLRPLIRFLLCGALSVISSFSAANGMLCFVVLLPVLAWPSSKAQHFSRRWLLAGWMMAFALSAGLYFHHFRKPVIHPGLTEMVVQWRKAPLYFVALLGAPFGLRKVSLSIIAGSILLALFVYCCWKFWRLLSDAAARRMLPWLALGSYSIMTAALITFGRLGFGVEQAMVPRYTTFMIYLSIALIYLFPIIVVADKHPSGRFAKKLTTTRVAPLLACVVIAVSLPTYFFAIRYVSIYRINLLQGKACLLFINIIRDDCPAILYPDTNRLRERANQRDRLSFLRPPLVRSNRIQDIQRQAVSDPGAYGSFVQLREVGTNKYEASGSALLPERREPADAVLLTLEDSYDGDSVFAIATLETQRDVVSALLGRGTVGDASWSKSFSLSRPGAGPLKISAWAFDSLSGKAYKLGGDHYIGKPADAAVR